ncbi:MAG: hypothetical protein J6U54_19840 [Clostridiales bacterium]|nr:hypothetical protein [Clostridiales bacterium]
MDDKILVHSKDIYHHGIDGQKWGKRKYQYEDGSLTPLGRVHYGVGQAREASKIKIREMKAETRNAVKLAKAQAKTAKAVANAEAKKIEAQTKAYKDRKEADNIVELERIKNDREADRNASEIAEKRLDNDYKIDRDLAEASKAQAENDSKSRNALKVVGGVLVAAGVGYLLYKAVKGNSVSSKENIEAGSNVINEFKNTPKSEIINKSNETNVQNLVSKTASKVTKTDKDLVNLTLGKVDKTKQAEKAGKQFGEAALKRLEKDKENM